nr:vegetative cell wall protein gp1-like [Paramormyrops kingsleyae]
MPRPPAPGPQGAAPASALSRPPAPGPQGAAPASALSRPPTPSPQGAAPASALSQPPAPGPQGAAAASALSQPPAPGPQGAAASALSRPPTPGPQGIMPFDFAPASPPNTVLAPSPKFQTPTSTQADLSWRWWRSSRGPGRFSVSQKGRRGHTRRSNRPDPVPSLSPSSPSSCPSPAVTSSPSSPALPSLSPSSSHPVVSSSLLPSSHPTDPSSSFPSPAVLSSSSSSSCPRPAVRTSSPSNQPQSPHPTQHFPFLFPHQLPQKVPFLPFPFSSSTPFHSQSHVPGPFPRPAPFVPFPSGSPAPFCFPPHAPGSVPPSPCPFLRLFVPGPQVLPPAVFPRLVVLSQLLISALSVFVPLLSKILVLSVQFLSFH